MVPGTGRLADWRMVQRSMDGFHHAEEPLSPDSLDGNSVRPADADFSVGRKRNSKPLLTQPPPSISRRTRLSLAKERDWSRGRPCPLLFQRRRDSLSRRSRQTGNPERGSHALTTKGGESDCIRSSLRVRCHGLPSTRHAGAHIILRQLGPTFSPVASAQRQRALASSGARRRLDFPDSTGHGHRFFASIHRRTLSSR